MKIYLAARFSKIKEMRVVKELLEKHGLTVTSSWLEQDGGHDDLKDRNNDWAFSEYAQMDLDDIDQANIFMLFSEDPEFKNVRGGRHVETGYALASNKTMIVIGPRENIFHCLPSFEIYDTVEEFLAWALHDQRE